MNLASFTHLLLAHVCANYPNGTKLEVPEGEEDHGCILNNPKLWAGRSFTIGTLDSHPLSYTSRGPDNKLVGEGVVFDIVRILQKKLGFDFTVVKPKENILGDADKGIIGLVHKKEVDFAAGFLPVFSEHAKLVQHSVSLVEAPWVVVMKRPTVSASGSGLLAPFDDTVWYLVLTSVLLVGPVIYFMMVLRVRLTANRTELDQVFPVGACMWFVYGALMKQGSTLSPRTDSSRILFATWWIFITLLTSFYTANLTAFLTLSKFTLPINDAKDIATKKVHWVAQAGGAIEYLISNDKTFDYLNISFQTGLGRFLNDADSVMLEMVYKEDVMYMREKQNVDHAMFRDYMDKAKDPLIEEKDRCIFVMTPQPFMAQSISFFYQLNSTLAHVLDPLLQALVEAGIVKHLLQRDLPQTEICPLDLGSKERQLRNSDLLMTYIIVVAGFSVATLVFFGEMLSRQVRRCLVEAQMRVSSASQTSALYPGDWKMAKQMHFVGKTMQFNGKDYAAPVRPPSTFLFQYTS